VGVRALRVLQVGKETVLGTSVPATAVMGGITDFTGKPVITNSQRRYLRGDYAPFHSVVQTDSRGQLNIMGDFACEDFPILMNSSIKGAVTGSMSDTSAYTYAFPFPMTASPAIETRTWEWSDTQQEYEMTSGMVESFVLTGDANSDVVKYTAKLIGLNVIKSTLTGALTGRAMTIMPASNMQLYIDALGGTIGTTVKASTLISWTFTYNTGLHLKKFASGGISPTLFGYGVPSATLQVIAEFNSVAVAEIDAHIAGTGRLYKLIGTNGLAGAVAALNTLDIQVAGDIITMNDLWGDLNGNTTMDITISNRYDAGAFANWGKLNVISKTATLLG
jgi:hypothetical protein